MLLRFSIQNFRSIKGRQTLDLTAIKTCKERQEENTFCINGTRLLKSVVFYGANASGKSNLMHAFRTFLRIVLDSAKESSSGDFIPFTPFKLNDQTSKEPTLFEIEFSIAGDFYRYGFSYTKEKVKREWLFKKNLGEKKEKPIFLRDEVDGKIVIDLIGLKNDDAIGISNKTRENALFLSVCDIWADKEAGRIVKYFSNNIEIIFSGKERPSYSTTELLNDPNMKKHILEFLKQADLCIKDLSVEEFELSIPDGLSRIYPSKIKKIVSIHNTYDNLGNAISNTTIPFHFESLGTQKAYALAGPIIDALLNGKVLFIDELDSRLHPIFIRKIVRLFNSSKTNPKNAQLIFNTHDTNLLNCKIGNKENSEKLLRRDQIYFAEKDTKEATHFYSLIEFKGEDERSIRNDASFGKDYLDGKYGAIPFIGNLFGFNED